MKRVIGLVDNYDDAQGLLDDLKGRGLSQGAIHILKGKDVDYEDRLTMWDRIKAFFGADVPEEDANYYAEGVRRKGVVVAADVPDEQAEDVADIMSDHGAVDIDKRASEWKASGWAGAQEEQGASIPVAEEEVKIGKREVSRGGIRVYSRVTERPVEEDVTLREERARVERRQVDRPATEEAFKERAIEIEETAEEPVVSKETRIKEEVIVGKETAQRTERVRETARRTEIEVEQQGRPSRAFDADFRNNFQSMYGSAGESYDTFSPAYEYGSSLASEGRYRGKNWSNMEPDVEKDWENRHPGTWHKFKDAIRYGWQRSTSR